MKARSLVLCLFALACFGCNIGNAPTPMEASEVQGAVDKLPPQDQIRYIQNSPLPQAEKDKRIAEIKAKHGL